MLVLRNQQRFPAKLTTPPWLPPCTLRRLKLVLTATHCHSPSWLNVQARFASHVQLTISSMYLLSVNQRRLPDVHSWPVTNMYYMYQQQQHSICYYMLPHSRRSSWQEVWLSALRCTFLCCCASGLQVLMDPASNTTILGPATEVEVLESEHGRQVCAAGTTNTVFTMWTCVLALLGAVAPICCLGNAWRCQAVNTCAGSCCTA